MVAMWCSSRGRQIHQNSGAPETKRSGDIDRILYLSSARESSDNFKMLCGIMPADTMPSEYHPRNCSYQRMRAIIFRIMGCSKNRLQPRNSEWSLMPQPPLSQDTNSMTSCWQDPTCTLSWSRFFSTSEDISWA